MTNMTTEPRMGRSGGESDIYTALLLVAFLFLLAAVIYVAYRAVTMFGSLLPPGGA
jgi:hypothetical protein